MKIQNAPQPIRIVGCFLEYDGKFLILFRHSHKPDGGTWCLPGGKVERGESDQRAMLRELEEETGYKASAAELQHIGDYGFISSRNEPLTYCTYQVALEDTHAVRLEASAHAQYKWVTAQECDSMPDLILGFPELLRLTGHIA